MRAFTCATLLANREARDEEVGAPPRGPPCSWRKPPPRPPLFAGGHARPSSARRHGTAARTARACRVARAHAAQPAPAHHASPNPQAGQHAKRGSAARRGAPLETSSRGCDSPEPLLASPCSRAPCTCVPLAVDAIIPPCTQPLRRAAPPPRPALGCSAVLPCCCGRARRLLLRAADAVCWAGCCCALPGGSSALAGARPGGVGARPRGAEVGYSYCGPPHSAGGGEGKIRACCCVGVACLH